MSRKKQEGVRRKKAIRHVLPGSLALRLSSVPALVARASLRLRPGNSESGLIRTESHLSAFGFLDGSFSVTSTPVFFSKASSKLGRPRLSVPFTKSRSIDTACLSTTSPSPPLSASTSYSSLPSFPTSALLRLLHPPYSSSHSNDLPRPPFSSKSYSTLSSSITPRCGCPLPHRHRWRGNPPPWQTSRQ